MTRVLLAALALLACEGANPAYVDASAWSRSHVAGPCARCPLSGQGRWVYGDGSEYVGGWLDQLPDGEGSLTHPAGWRYDGGWRRGLYHGHGALCWADRCAVGGWSMGVRHGRVDVWVGPDRVDSGQYEHGRRVGATEENEG